MSRSLFLLLAVLGLAIATPAHAQPAERGGVTVPSAPGACLPAVEAAVKSAAIGASNIVCEGTSKVAIDVAGDGQGGQLSYGDARNPIHVRLSLPDGRTATMDVMPDGTVLAMEYVHHDLSDSSGKGMAILFWLFAAASVGGALFVVSRKNLIAAVMGMVGSFLGIAAIYMMLYAQFLAVIQMLVYAGAIMVLFVFVVMILNRPEDEPVAPAGRVGQVIGGIAILYLVGRLVVMLMQVQVPDAKVALAAPLATAQGHAWGSVGAVGTDLFGPGLFPFEAISILLLIAVVGAIAIARPLHVEDDAPAKARSEGVA
ncbi:MAG TPA: NADH-quinone oxidoreductase subunit J [Kofleriaceae bacterium]|nr:NADH-quinone oxidoreductase subunit J [Kofleriaceae bacterium]